MDNDFSSPNAIIDGSDAGKPARVARAIGTTAPTLPLPGAAAALVSWLVVSLIELTMMAAKPYGGTSSVWRVAQAYLLQLGNGMAVGVASAIVIAAWVAVRSAYVKPEQRLTRGIADAAALLFAAGWIAFFFLRSDFDQLAHRKAADLHLKVWQIRTACLLALGLVTTVAMVVGRLLARSWQRYVGVAIALAAAVANYFFLRGDYFNLHFAQACFSVSLLAASLTGLPIPNRRSVRRAGFVVLLASAVLAALAISRPAPPGAASRMLATRCDPFAILMRGYHGREVEPVIPPEQAAWFSPRTNVPPIASISDVEEAQRAIVLMLTIDSFRGDAFESGKNDRFFPEMTKMRREGVHFTRAHSPGSQTIYTLPTWFTGKYFSQLVWKPDKKGDSLTWPAQDPTKQFPVLLDEQGIPSTYVQAANWLTASHGLVRGFSSYVDLQTGETFSEYAHARRVSQVVIDRLDDQSAGPLYVFAHFLDAHVPYHDAKGGTHFQQYLHELRVIDHEIARIRSHVAELGLTDRTTIIVSADHGESFGDHGGLQQHGVSVYEDLIHVPLVIVGPHFPARTIDTLVSTIDIGPTILDTFGLPTPGWMMGESLLGVLRGGEPNFTRPIVAENRLRQTMLFPDGMKISRDLHFGDGDAFDLVSDPLELDNRIDDPTFDTANRFALLKAFFDAHTLRTPTYKPPYRK